jgi:hypothetical protein
MLGAIFEMGMGASGFCFEFDVASNNLTTILVTTAGAGARLWMAGQGRQRIRMATFCVLAGNGDFGGVSQWGDADLTPARMLCSEARRRRLSPGLTVPSLGG